MDNCQFILLVTDISRLSIFVSLCCQELIDNSQPRPIETGYQFSKKNWRKFLSVVGGHLQKGQIKARFTLGVRAKKNLGPTLSSFGLQIGLPNLMIAYPFFSLWANTRPKCSAFISNLGAD
jgi:hypothetical protein